MPWTEWFAFKHPVLIHVPIAVAILIPLALMAAQRPGRGIRPWWLVARYLAWFAVVFMLASALSGFLLARHSHVLPAGLWLAPKTDPEGALLRLHQLLAASSVGIGLCFLYLAHRRRQDHQSLGFLALLVGLLWSTSLLWTGWQGARMSRPVQVQTVVVKEKEIAPAAPVAPIAVAAPAPTGDLPARLLDFASLEPIQKEPVKTTVHGLRWIRTWVSPAAAEAYRAGQSLPAGSRVVMQSFEDKWGRPSSDPGPLYGLEIQPDGKSSLTLYWGRVPETRRGEVGGAERVWWTSGDANLEGCMACHAQGMAPAKDRSTVFPFRKPKDEGAVPRN